MANLFIAQTVNFYFKHFQVIKGKTSLNLVNLSRTSYPLEKNNLFICTNNYTTKKVFGKGELRDYKFLLVTVHFYIILSKLNPILCGPYIKIGRFRNLEFLKSRLFLVLDQPVLVCGFLVTNRNLRCKN